LNSVCFFLYNIDRIYALIHFKQTLFNNLSRFTGYNQMYFNDKIKIPGNDYFKEAELFLTASLFYNQ